MKTFKEFLNESEKPVLPLSKQEIKIRKLFSTPLSPVIKKICEWILYRYTNEDAEFDVYTVISASGNELVYKFQWEFNSDLPPDLKILIGLDAIFNKLVPNCKTIELNVDNGMPSFELIGVMTRGGNQGWMNKVRDEEDTELYNGTLQKKFSPYNDLNDYVYYIVKEQGLDPIDFFGWASSDLSVSEYQYKSRGKILGRKFSV